MKNSQNMEPEKSWRERFNEVLSSWKKSETIKDAGLLIGVSCWIIALVICTTKDKLSGRKI